MILPCWSLLVLLLVNLLVMCCAKLPCQTGSVRKRARIGTFLKPDLCCGGRPFNSGLSTCCLGKILKRSQKKCCLDGTSAPAASTCLCHPSSDWAITEMDRLEIMESQLTTVIEDLDDRMSTLQQQVIGKEERLEAFDARANVLYKQFLREINIGENQDPGEVNYIIQLVLFMNSNEELVEDVTNSVASLEESAQHLLDSVIDSTDPYNENSEQNVDHVPEHLRRIRREIEITESNVQSAQSATEVARDEVAMTLPSSINRTEIERLILERSRVNKSIMMESESLLKSRHQLTTLRRLRSIMVADRQLLASMAGLLDTALNQALNIEAAAREEFPERESRGEVERREKRDVTAAERVGWFRGMRAARIELPQLEDIAEEEEDETTVQGSRINDSQTPTAAVAETTASTRLRITTASLPRTARPKPKCNFAAWDTYMLSFSDRARFVALDIQDLLSSNSSSSAASDSTHQLRNLTEKSFFSRAPAPRDVEWLSRKRRETSTNFFEISNVGFIGKIEKLRRSRQAAFPWLSTAGSGPITGERLRSEILSKFLKLPTGWRKSL